MLFLQLAILSHCLTDFVFQTKDIAELKKNPKLIERIKANAIHGLNVVIVLFAFLIINYKLTTVLFYTVCIGIGHFIIDLIKSSLSIKINHSVVKAKNKGNEEQSILNMNFNSLYAWCEPILFILDQMLHCLIIIWIWTCIDIESGGILSTINPMPSKLSIILMKFNRASIINTLTYLIVYLFTCFGGRFLINIIMTRFDFKTNKPDSYESRTETNTSYSTLFKGILKRISIPEAIENHEPNENKATDSKNVASHWIIPASDYIGIFERFIIITLVVNGAYQAITFIFTAKSLARFRELEDKLFVEYYLVGTLLSTSLAILGGVLLGHLK
ncbi:MAG: DUF3307 domain-containing protein [Clostridiaceae bacterium]|nr:DUF3307 domain-containing protein [Clostridiaceae bacterium]